MEQSGLFSAPISEPLAHRMRPRSLGEWVGHDKWLSEKSPLKTWIKNKTLPSLLLWGPPGVGKTSLAHLIAQELGDAFIPLSAVTSGVKDIKEAADQGRRYRELGRKTILFFDEIHRLNKGQQDALLPFVETGILTLIGATTENPSFEVNAALLSRLRVVKLERLTDDDLKTILKNTLADARGLNGKFSWVTEDLLNPIVQASEGDARRALTTLEALTLGPWLEKNPAFTPDDVQVQLQTLGTKAIPFDKAGEEHYNVISAFIKSMRASDPDAAVYYLARLIEGGEDPLFIARRMVVFASEDVGNADPRALLIAIAVKEAVEFVGMPEGRINLAQGAISLALAKKDRAIYNAIEAALTEVRETGALPVPMVLRNAVSKLMKDAGYGKGDPEKRLPEGLNRAQFFDQKKL